MNMTRYAAAAAALRDGRVLVTGGHLTGAGTRLSSADLYVPPFAALIIDPPLTRLGVGTSKTIAIDLHRVTDLYGYQFQVNYDAGKVSASGAFVGSFFDTTDGNTAIPDGWNASCAGGVCRFAASKYDEGQPVSGSGTLATIMFTGVAAGSVALTFTSDTLSDHNGLSLVHDSGTATLTVYGTASASGTAKLQGRDAPGDGTVTFTDLGGLFPPATGSIGAGGEWSISNLPTPPGGTLYQMDAAHSLYLGNRMTHCAERRRRVRGRRDDAQSRRCQQRRRHRDRRFELHRRRLRRSRHRVRHDRQQ